MDLKAELLARKEKCFLCKWILEDLEQNKVLTKYPVSAMDGSSQFPVEGKVKHLILEGFWRDDLGIIGVDVVKKAKEELAEGVK